MSEAFEARIAELEQENRRLRRLLDAQNVPSTLRHQVRNALGLMRAILRRSAETSANVEDYAAHAEGRFDALLRVQTLLISAVDEGVPLHSVIANELVAHVIHEGEQATFEGPPVQLGPKTAQLLGLAFHELAVNAVKFGAMTTPEGRIHVSWFPTPASPTSADPTPASLTLVWRETGTPILPAPTFRGFGVETLENMLRYELEAESLLQFRPGGLECEIRLPFSRSQQ